MPSVDTPALIVVGSRDALTPAWHSRRMARALPDAELVLLPGSGHQLMLEPPQELNDLLDGFTERVGSAAAQG